jgi:hypothetical protein
MRESRPYGSERGAFSNGRPYRDRIDDDRGRRSPDSIKTFAARRVAGVDLKNAVAALEVYTPRGGFVRRSESRIEFRVVVVRFVIEPQEINK